MTASQYNELVRAAARNQPLRGVKRFGVGLGSHDWKITAMRGDDLSGLDPKLGTTWRVYVGPGAVNDRIAVITYLREGDPRGWTMPGDYPAASEMRKAYGDEFKIVDRRLTDRDEPPYLIAQPPVDPHDLGDFERVPDTAERPSFFRTEAMWEKELYRASVFVIAGPQHYMRFEDLLHFPLTTRFTRFRVALARALPSKIFGTDVGGFFELGRLYLLREPGAPERDQVFVQQRCFWSLWTANSNPNPYGGFDPFGGQSLVTGIPFIDAGVSFGELLAQEALQVIAEIYESAASVEFWTV